MARMKKTKTRMTKSVEKKSKAKARVKATVVRGFQPDEFHHTTNTYGKKGKSLSRRGNVWNTINQAVQSGKATTPKALLALFPTITLAVTHRIGRMVNLGNWEVKGFPRTRDNGKDSAANRKLGEAIVAKAPNTTIKVVREFAAKSA